MNKDEWGNIELPGFDDSKLLNPLLNVHLGRKALMDTPKWAEIVARRAKTASENADDEFREHMANLSIEKWKDPEFRNLQEQSHAEYWADPANHEERSIIMQEVAQRPEVKKNIKAGHERRAKDPKDLALRKEVGARKKGDPVFSKACKDSVTPERIDKFKDSTLKYKDPVVTPLGVFRCVSDAALAHKVDNGWIRRRIAKLDPTNYYYITLEQYEQLKNK